MESIRFSEPLWFRNSKIATDLAREMIVDF